MPYVEISLGEAGRRLPVTDVVVGPALDFDLNGLSIRTVSEVA